MVRTRSVLAISSRAVKPRLGKRGVVRTVGVGQEAKRMLTA